MARHPSTAVPGLPVTGESHRGIGKSREQHGSIVVAAVASEQTMADALTRCPNG